MTKFFVVRSSKCLTKYGKMVCEFVLKEDHDTALAERDKLIEQMRWALEYALTEARSTECERLIEAALSAERGE